MKLERGRADQEYVVCRPNTGLTANNMTRFNVLNRYDKIDVGDCPEELVNTMIEQDNKGTLQKSDEGEAAAAAPSAEAAAAEAAAAAAPSALTSMACVRLDSSRRLWDTLYSSKVLLSFSLFLLSACLN